MKIKKVHIENFGRLSGFDRSFGPGCNRICGENGWGKTTLAVFIRVMFYGFPAKGERAEDRERYRPWQGGIYGGSLTFETKEGCYTIYRTFGASKSGREDSFQLLDEETKKLSGRWSAQIGAELFGINEDSFVNTAWISQTGSGVRTSSDLVSGIGSGGELLEDVKQYDRAAGLLDRHLNQLSPAKKSGKLRKLCDEKEELEQQVRRGEALERALEELREKQAEEKARLDQLLSSLEDLQRQQQEYSRWQDFLAQKEVHETLQKEYLRRDEAWAEQQDQMPEQPPAPGELDHWLQVSDQLTGAEARWDSLKLSGREKKELEKLIEKKQKNDSSEGQPAGDSRLLWIGVVAAVLGAGFLAGAFFAGFPADTAGLILFGTGVLVFLTGLLTAFLGVFMQKGVLYRGSEEYRCRMLLQRQEESLRAEKDVLEKKEQLRSYILSLGLVPEEQPAAQLRRLFSLVQKGVSSWEELQRADREIRNFYRNNPGFEAMADMQVPEEIASVHSMRELRAEAEEKDEQIRICRERMQKYKQQEEQLMEERRDIMLQEEKLDRLEEELEACRKEYRITELTKRYLTEAREAYAVRHIGPVQEAFSRYYAMLDPEQKENLFIDSDFMVRVTGGGVVRSEDVLSMGYRNLAGLCLRFALLDAMAEKERPVVLMDDPFLYFDEEKQRQVAHFLRTAGERYQILLFLCRDE